MNNQVQVQDEDKNQDFTLTLNTKKIILYILKLSTKFGFFLQFSYQNKKSAQDQVFTLNFNTRTTFDM